MKIGKKFIVGISALIVAIGGLTANLNYYIIAVDDNNFKLALTDANAQSGTAINLTNTGTGNHTFTVDVFSNPAYAGTLLEQFFTESISDSSVSENFTLIRFDIGPLAKYQGYYYSNDGFLSDGIYLQDSKYYQKYSYLITVDERLQDYKTKYDTAASEKAKAFWQERIDNSQESINEYYEAQTALINKLKKH
jgi:hypothetical protein